MQDLILLPKPVQPPCPFPFVKVDTSNFSNTSYTPLPKYYCCTSCKYINPIYASDPFQYCYKCNMGQYVSDSLSELFRGECKSCKGTSYFHFNNSETVSCEYCHWVCHITDLTVDGYKNPAFYTSKAYCNKCGYDSMFCLHVDNPTGKWSCAGCMSMKVKTKNAPAYTAPGYKNDIKPVTYYYASDGTSVSSLDGFLPKVHYSCGYCLSLADHSYNISGSDYVTYKCMVCGAYKEFIKQEKGYTLNPEKVDITWDSMPPITTVDWSIAPSKPKITKVEKKKEIPVPKKTDSESIIAYIRDIERVYHYLNDDKFICGYILPSSKNNVERLSKKDQDTVLKHLSSYMCKKCAKIKNEATVV
jgi:hypothetical protein